MTQRADLVLDRPARRQPGARQPDGHAPQAALLRAARLARLQGDRGRLPGGVGDRLRLRPRAHRRGPRPRRRDARRADAGAAGADRAHVRGGRGRAARDRPPLQLDVGRRSAASSSGSTAPASPSSRCAAPSSAAGSRARRETEIGFEYSPESFHHTELDYALEICEAVAAEWGPTPDEKMIVNLPTTVEQFPPNVYADRIEWFGRNFSQRDAAILSVHPHNDRGTAVATAELGLMAGAERVEGTLFGNGERTGNVDLVTLALNLLTQGVDPKLDLSQLDEATRDRRGVQRAAGASASSVGRRARLHGVLRLAPGRDQEGDARAGGAPATSSGTCRTCRSTRRTSAASYEAIIRVNSQSGKGGVAYLLHDRTGSTCRAGCRSSSRSRCRRSPTSRAASCRPRSSSSCSATQYLDVAAPYELARRTATRRTRPATG